MKWWFKLNRNRLYRRFNFDPHNFIIKSFKIDKAFKYLVFKKKFTFQKKKKKRSKRLSFLFKKIAKLKLKKKLWREQRRIRKIKSSLSILDRNSSNKKWYSNFWANIKLNYRKKQHNTRRFKKITRAYYKFRTLRNLNMKRLKFKVTYLKRKKIKTAAKKQHKFKRRMFRAKFVWLKMQSFKKRDKTWWSLRIIIRKSAIYYGFNSLKKYRNVNRFVDHAMSTKQYTNDKLESMLNIFLLNINIFDNIFVSSNFIKYSGLVYINDGIIWDSQAYVGLSDIVCFSNIKKIQSIFVKRCKFSKSFYVKKYKRKSSSITLSRPIKIIKNVPLNIHYDYQIMCFCIYRLKTFKETYSSLKTLKNNWNVDTKLQYN